MYNVQHCKLEKRLIMKGKILAVKKGQWKFKESSTQEEKVIDNINIVIGYPIIEYGAGYCPYVSKATKKPWFVGSYKAFKDMFDKYDLNDASELVGLCCEVTFLQSKSTIAKVIPLVENETLLD